MNMRKFVVVGGLAAGAAFALAPLASADDPLTPVVAGEVASMNFLFGTDTTLAGVPAGDIESGPQGFDIIKPADVSAVQDSGTNLFDHLVYGVNPVTAGLATDPGAYNVFNGGMVPFDDGINSLLFALANNGGVLAFDSGDLFGGTSASDIANAAANGWAEAANYFSLGMGDFLGYLGI